MESYFLNNGRFIQICSLFRKLFNQIDSNFHRIIRSLEKDLLHQMCWIVAFSNKSTTNCSSWLLARFSVGVFKLVLAAIPYHYKAMMSICRKVDEVALINVNRV